MLKKKIKSIVSSIGKVFLKLFNIAKFERIVEKNEPTAVVKRINNMKRLAVMLGLLILIFVAAIFILRGCQRGEIPHGTVHIPGNVIDSGGEQEAATSLELTAKEGFGNIQFETKNILPGDSITQYYCISVSHSSPQTVRFSINTDKSQKLTNVLRVKVEELLPDAEDVLLYDGLMKDCNAVDINVSSSSGSVTPIYYRITVYTNGREVGNEYAGESLTADFSWQLQ